MGAGLWRFPWFIPSEELHEGTAQGKKGNKHWLSSWLAVIPPDFCRQHRGRQHLFPALWGSCGSSQMQSVQSEKFGVQTWKPVNIQQSKSRGKKAHSRQLQPKNPGAIPRNRSMVSQGMLEQEKMEQSNNIINFLCVFLHFFFLNLFIGFFGLYFASKE